MKRDSTVIIRGVCFPFFEYMPSNSLGTDHTREENESIVPSRYILFASAKWRSVISLYVYAIISVEVYTTERWEIQLKRIQENSL